MLAMRLISRHLRRGHTLQSLLPNQVLPSDRSSDPKLLPKFWQVLHVAHAISGDILASRVLVEHFIRTALFWLAQFLLFVFCLLPSLAFAGIACDVLLDAFR